MSPVNICELPIEARERVMARIQPVVITIDPEFQELIPSLSESEFGLLRQQLITQGCLTALCVWKTADGQRILLDGHNRYRICTENNIGYQTVNVTLASREAATLWILEQQAGRRNLTDDQRAIVWNRIREQRSHLASIEGAAKARAAKTDSANSSNSESKPKRDTRAAVAKEARLPESALRAAQTLETYQPALAQKVLAGEIKLRDTAKARRALVKPKDLKTRYAEKDFYRRVGTGLAGAFSSVQDRLDELTHIQKSDWSPEADEGLRSLIVSLNEIAERADDYASQFKEILKSHKVKAA